MNYPKYQYSRFVNNGDQIVVRTEDGLEFERLVKFVDNFKQLPKENPNLKPRYQENAPPVRETPYSKAETTENVTVDEFELNHICPAHSIQMKERVGKDGKKWFDHRQKTDGGVWQRCYGKGWKS